MSHSNSESTASTYLKTCLECQALDNPVTNSQEPGIFDKVFGSNILTDIYLGWVVIMMDGEVQVRLKRDS
jgi:hypothetical protein